MFLTEYITLGVAIGEMFTRVRFDARSAVGSQSVQIGMHFGTPFFSRLYLINRKFFLHKINL